MGSTYIRQMQSIANEYIQHTGRSPVTAREIATWAIRNRKWQPQPSDLINQCAEQFARAMREEYIVDAQGRSVRAKHAARVEQTVLWADIGTASRNHMEVAL